MKEIMMKVLNIMESIDAGFNIIKNDLYSMSQLMDLYSTSIK